MFITCKTFGMTIVRLIVWLFNRLRDINTIEFSYKFFIEEFILSGIKYLEVMIKDHSDFFF